MHSCRRLLLALLTVSLLVLTARSGSRPAQGKTPKKGESLEGFRIEQIEQKRTEKTAWIRVRILSDTRPEETWAVLQNLEEWDRFVKLFPRVTPLETAKTMTRYRLAVSPPWPIPDFESVVWIKKLPDQHRFLWRVDQENLTGNHGSVEVREIQGGSRIIYESYAPVQNTFPAWVVKIGLYLVLPAVAEDFYDWIRQQD